MPVRADQTDRTGLFERRPLKRQALMDIRKQKKKCFGTLKHVNTHINNVRLKKTQYFRALKGLYATIVNKKTVLTICEMIVLATD